MSTVTNVVLSFSIVESIGGTDDDVLKRINEFFGDNNKPGFVKLPLTSTGGSKAMERPTFVSAFNYFALEPFLAHLKSLPWERPESVQLFVCGQDDDHYYLIYVFENKEAE